MSNYSWEVTMRRWRSTQMIVKWPLWLLIAFVLFASNFSSWLCGYTKGQIKGSIEAYYVFHHTAADQPPLVCYSSECMEFSYCYGQTPAP
jgi:hypothetical protein